MPKQAPTEADISKLPLMAKVAFAARCTRRLVPFFQRWAAGRPSLSNALRTIVGGIEKFTSSPLRPNSQIHHVVVEVKEARKFLEMLVQNPRPNFADFPACATAKAGLSALNSALEVANTSSRAPTDQAVVVTGVVYNSLNSTVHDVAANAIEALNGYGHARGQSKIFADYKLLRQLSKKHGWNDHTPVPPSVFERLENQGVVPQSSEGRYLEIALDVPENVPDEAVIETVKAVTGAADQIHRDLGGHGLKIRTIEVLNEAGKPVEVP